MINITDLSETTDVIQKEVIDIYKVYSVKNIVSYNHVSYAIWSVSTKSVPTSDKQNLYFVCDTIFESAFGHWVFESAIYLPLYKLLKLKNPTLKLYLKTKKTFKTLFCKYFNIPDEDIVYTFDNSRQSLAYFPSPISAFNSARLDLDYVKQLDVFWKLFRPEKHIPETNSVVVMPRQTKENFRFNDRVVLFKKIIEHVEKIPNHIILHTDGITDINTQIDILRNSNNIILTDGSALMVNGMFSYDKNIIVSGAMVTQGQRVYLKIDHIIKKITLQNKSVVFIPNEDNACKQLDVFMK